MGTSLSKRTHGELEGRSGDMLTLILHTDCVHTHLRGHEANAVCVVFSLHDLGLVYFARWTGHLSSHVCDADLCGQKVRRTTNVGALEKGIFNNDYANVIFPTSRTRDLQTEVALAANIGHRCSSSSAGDALLHPTLSCHFHGKSTSCRRNIMGKVKQRV